MDLYHAFWIDKTEETAHAKNYQTFEATFETVARFSVKPPNQSITDIELNDASVGIKAQTMGVAATKNNANGMVLDHPPTNDNKLDHFASDVECPLGKTGTTIMCC